MASIDLIRASNGSGDAVKATVTNARVISSTTLQVDATTNWPSKFIATVGDVDGTGAFVPATVTVFNGILSGGNIEITSFAPGYTDIGNTPGQIVVLKPTTAWANEVADTLAVAHSDSGTLKAGAVDNAAVLASNVVETAKIKDGAVTAGKLGLVMVSAYKSGSPQSLSAGTWTLVTLNSENFDVGGNFASNKFTAPTTGYYLVSITCVIGIYGISSTAYASAAIYKNGSRFQQTMTIQGSGNANTIPRLSTTALMSLTAGDYIELYAVCSEAGRYVDVGNETSLIVVQVG